MREQLVQVMVSECPHVVPVYIFRAALELANLGLADTLKNIASVHLWDD